MPIRSGAMQRPNGCRCGNTLRQRYDEVGLPWSNTMGLPSPTSTYAISRPRTRRRPFWYGNAAEIMFASKRSHRQVECNLNGRSRVGIDNASGCCQIHLAASGELERRILGRS